MDLPITRPSMISYADELNFSELLGELKSKRYNGFIRVTYNSEEGYILFKDGKQVAASYDKDSKVEAIKKIKSAADEGNTLVEVFDLRESQIKYLIDINKAYLIDSNSEVHDMLDELKKSTSKNEIKPPSPEEEKSEVQDNAESVNDDLKAIPQVELDPAEEVKIKSENLEINKESENIVKDADISNEVKVETEEAELTIKENKDKTVEELKPVTEEKEDTIIEKSAPDIEVKSEEPEFIDEAIDRAELMKKYGLKDVGEEEVENILDSYKGGTLSDEDVEKIELTLMNKIKKSILGIPKIKGTEVMVFLDNTSELTGTINIITEYESKGFLSRIMGESKDLENLKTQIINITQIEIKKSFRGYPEIVDDFKINVEVS